MSEYLPGGSAVKCRIFRDHVEERPWHLDGYNPAPTEWNSSGYTEECWRFQTWAEAIAAVPSFIQYLGREAA